MFTLKTVIFSIFRWYFRNFVGTNDILCRVTCTDKTPKKHYWGGGGNGWKFSPASLERRIIHKVLGVKKNAR